MERRAFLQLLGMTAAALAVPVEIMKAVEALPEVIPALPLRTGPWVVIDGVDVSPFIASITTLLRREAIPTGTLNGFERYTPGLLQAELEADLIGHSAPFTVPAGRFLVEWGYDDKFACSMPALVTALRSDFHNGVLKSRMTLRNVGPITRVV